MGWPILAALVVALLMTIIVVLIKGHRARRYRRLAVLLLHSLDAKKKAKTIVESCEIIKRVALKSFGRDIVAALTGQEWLTFLETKYKTFDLKTRDILTHSQYKTSEQLANINEDHVILFRTEMKNWIKHHHV